MSPAWTQIRKRDPEKAAPKPVAEAPPLPEPAPESISFASIHLAIGDALQMQPVVDNHLRYYVTLIGYVEKRSVLVTAPVIEGHVQLVREGQPFVLRAFSGRNAYAFDASVLKSCGAPFPYLHLSYPKSVQTLPVRSEQRLRVNLIGAVPEVEGVVQGEPQACLVVDLSLGGAMITAPRRLVEVGHRFKLSIRIVANQAPVYVALPCVLRNLREAPATDGRGSVLHHGVQFLEIDAKDQLLLENFIFRAMLSEL